MNKQPRTASEDIGFSTLVNISRAGKLNTWMFNAIRPWLKGRILEIGSGIGNISSVLIKNEIPVYLSDYDDKYYHLLREKFSAVSSVKDIYQINLVDKEFETTHAHLLGSFDSIFALNVIEHIANDLLAVENCYKLLAPGGRLVLLMPAYPALYNDFDEGLGHFRRYTRQTMNKLLARNFKVIKIRHFNLAGIFGWFFFGSILRKKNLTGEQMGAFEKMVPLFRLADKIVGNKIGLSIIGVGEKKAPTHT